MILFCVANGGDDSEPATLSDGQIAGIAVGSAFVVVLVAALIIVSVLGVVYVVVIKKKRNK